VPSEHLETLPEKVKNLFEDIAAKGIDMERMKMVIDRERLKVMVSFDRLVPTRPSGFLTVVAARSS